VLDRFEFVPADSAAADDVVADDPYPALTDRAVPQLAVVRDSEFADHDHIEWCAEGLRHLEGHRYSASRQAQDDGILPPYVP
jgi:hypothetical protein